MQRAVREGLGDVARAARVRDGDAGTANPRGECRWRPARTRANCSAGGSVAVIRPMSYLPLRAADRVRRRSSGREVAMSNASGSLGMQLIEGLKSRASTARWVGIALIGAGGRARAPPLVGGVGVMVLMGGLFPLPGF